MVSWFSPLILLCFTERSFGEPGFLQQEKAGQPHRKSVILTLFRFPESKENFFKQEVKTMNASLKDHYLQTGPYTYAGPYQDYFRSLPDDPKELGDLISCQIVHRVTLREGNRNANADRRYGDMGFMRTVLPESDTRTVFP